MSRAARFERWPEVVAVALLGFAGVQRHPHPQRDGVRPFLGQQAPLRFDGCGDRLTGALEGGGDAVAPGREHEAAVSIYGAAQDGVVACQRLFHDGGMRVPQLGRALDVGEQECHRARWTNAHVSIVASVAMAS